MMKMNGTLTFVVTCLGLCALAPVASAAEATSYEMGAYINAPGGSEIEKGDYTAAIAIAESVPKLDSESQLVAATNLCVALTVTRALGKAAPACNRALSLARAAESSIRSIRMTHEATIRALTNRGVLRAVSGDSIGAAADFRIAAKMSGNWPAPSQNLAYLESLPSDRVARADPAKD